METAKHFLCRLHSLNRTAEILFLISTDHVPVFLSFALDYHYLNTMVLLKTYSRCVHQKIHHNKVIRVTIQMQQFKWHVWILEDKIGFLVAT